MFTGIISLVEDSYFVRATQELHIPLRESHGSFWKGVQTGDSIAINGVCLTVTEISDSEVTFFLQEETLKCTTFGALNSSEETQKIHANLERAMSSFSSWNGHIVLGHVHGTANISSVEVNRDGSWEMVVELPPCPEEILGGLFRKGSITFDGVSLTITDLFPLPNKRKGCKVSLIPYTLAHTTLHLRKRGDLLNVEFASPTGVAAPILHTAEQPALSDSEWMARAVELGEKGRPTSAPNPWVGCVIVAKDKRTVLGEGFHFRAGEKHAEVLAVHSAIKRKNPHTSSVEIDEILQELRSSHDGENKENLALRNDFSQATLYVTLEPCHHTGRTPPCDSLVSALGIPKVVVALLDPDDRVSGKGIKYLQEAGVEVVVGVGALQARRSLAAYLHHRRCGLPLCVLKIAQSMDGKIACEDGSSQWITGPDARRHAHKIRSQSQAIMVGFNTAVIDKPQLTVRNMEKELHPLFKQPLRVVLDTRGRLSDGPLIEDASNVPTLIFTTHQVNETTKALWEKSGVDFEIVPQDEDGRVNMATVLKVLGQRGVLQVLVEGGPLIQSSLILQMPHCIGSLITYTGGMLLGSSAIPWASRILTRTITESVNFSLTPLDVQLLGNDIITTYEPTDTMKQHVDSRDTHPCDSETLLSPMETVIDTIKTGGMVLVMDEASRENEGDLVMAARFCSERHAAKMIRHTSGILCAPMTKEHAKHLELPLMVKDNADKHGTAFTVTCDASLVSTGVSASDRALTFQLLAKKETTPNELSRPGHIFPLIAKPGLLKERSGHTEASVTLCVLAGIDPPVACIGEVTNDDGTMARSDAVGKFGKMNSIPVTTVTALKEYIESIELPALSKNPNQLPCLKPAKLLAECTLPIGDREGVSLGEWNMACYTTYSAPNTSPHMQDHVRVVLMKGSNLTNDDPPLVRIHSACFTGDVLGSERCDCSSQLTMSMKHIAKLGRGIIMYEIQQEGRGIGLVEKIKAYSLLEKRPDLDTYSVNSHLGHHADLRNYRGAAEVLVALNIQRIKLMTTNPEKVKSMASLGIEVVSIDNESVSAPVTEENRRYLAAKASAGHSISTLNLLSSDSPPSLSLPSSSSSLSSLTSCSPPAIVGMKVPKSLSHSLSKQQLFQLRFGVIRTTWNEEMVSPLVDSCITKLQKEGVPADNIVCRTVPGCYELPLTAKYLIERQGVSAVICIGLLVKGETMHFEYISEAVSQALMKLQMKTSVPVIYGVLNVLTKEQAAARANPQSNLASSWALSALQMASLMN